MFLAQFEIFSLLVYIFIKFKIYIFSLHENDNETKFNISKRIKSWCPTLKFNRQMISRNTNNFIILILFISILMLTIKVNNTSPRDINRYPNFLYLYVYQMIFPNIIGNFVMGFYFFQNPAISSTILSEIKKLFFRDNLNPK